jgi:hypothetical protein
MGVNFEELDYQQTALGELILRRRQALALGGREIFEVKLNDEFLMSSLFHDGEVALTDLGLAELTGQGWDIVVGGLGLGYTAAAALKYDQVARMIVVEALAPVIEWHQRELVPNGTLLSKDARCRYYHEDFFALARGLTPYFLILTTRRMPCSIPVMQTSIRKKGCCACEGFSSRGACSGYGLMTSRTGDSWPFCPGCSIRLTDTPSNLKTRFRAKRRRTGYTSPRLKNNGTITQKKVDE